MTDRGSERGPGDASGAQDPEPRRLGPGVLVAERYRISGFLGRGGMGEVYRADDLLLEQPVALKFLPDSFRNDRVRLKRFYAEVRLARQITHPAVCRTHDVQHHEGRPFLSMELVDGEDLRTLLRRIGRLAPERALAIARQLCGGLAAAHAQGILHRDLKPENVMIDGQGNVRVMDFGLAASEAVSAEDLEWTARSPWHEALAAVADVTEEVYGTPAYMAPEQLAGGEATVASDVYALGLVLYELFTGERAFAGERYRERVREQTERGVVRPSSHVADLDPRVEDVILRCLAADPAERPPSALAVAAALPGGDPLAAALAAGETPSPEVVAAAGEAGGLRPAVAAAYLAAIAAGIALVAILADRLQPFFEDLDLPPQVLVHEARGLLAELGPEIPAADAAHDFVLEGPLGGAQRLVFWYRQSPRSLAEARRLEDRRLAFSNPPLLVPGMTGVRLDAHGTLLEYVRVPAPDEAESPGRAEWRVFFGRAGLEWSLAGPARPSTIPPVFGDERYAWTVKRGEERVGVEAASFRGRPVWFEATGLQPTPSAHKTGLGVYPPLSLLFLVVVVALRHLRMGRGDRVGAVRIALIGLVWEGAGPVLFDPRWLAPAMFWILVLNVLFWTFTLWALYLGLEPIARRRWPETLVSWTRLLHGRPLDPLVGRHVLFGVLAGIGVTLVEQGLRIDFSAVWPTTPTLLIGGRRVLGSLIQHGGSAVLFSLTALMLLVLVRQALRRPWPAFAVAVLLLYFVLAGLAGPWGWRGLEDGMISLLSFALPFGILVGPGMLACVVAVAVNHLLGSSLMTTHLGAWYADSALASILTTAALAAWGAYAALATRSAPGPES